MKVVLIGSGNVAWHLGKALRSVGHDILQVFSRNKTTAFQLAELTGAGYTTDINALDVNADLYLLCLKDDQIKEVAHQMKPTEAIVAHTSGAVNMDILAPFAKNFGVFYPFQSFTREQTLDLSTVPFLIEGTSSEVETSLVALAKDISTSVQLCDAESRLHIHIAGVFASNFVNHMLYQAKERLDSKSLDYDLLKPLVEETIKKAFEIGPFQAQTGPARRTDEETLNKHFNTLAEGSTAQNLYKVISESIAKLYQKES